MTEEPRVEQEPDDVDTTAVPVAAEYCLNCSALLAGRYCSSCGQKKSRLRIGFREFLHDLLHEFLHLDGKFARTMRLLATKPGLLTVEFLAGRRASYVSPLRLYLVWSAVFFTLALSFPGAVVLKMGSGPDAKTALESAETAPASGAPDAEKSEGLSKSPRDFKKLSETFLHDAAKGMFLLMPFFGLLLFIFYRKREPFYLPHLYFSIHYHSFVFLVMSILVLLRAPKIGALDKVSSFVELAVMIYLYLSLRRVYGASRLGTVCRMIGVGFIYMLGLGATFAAILAYRVIYA